MRVGYIALLGIPVDGKLPCQKKSQDKKVKFEEKQNQKDRGNWLPGTLKFAENVGAAKAAADSCCGDKPYSSASRQCCFGKVVGVEEQCCISGAFLSSRRSKVCSCLPKRSWIELEMRRMIQLLSTVHGLKTQLELSLKTLKSMVEENLEKVKELDQSAVILGEKFHDLIEIEPGDPEAQLIEEEIVNESKNTGGRPARRSRQRARRSWDEFVPDYYAQEIIYSEEIYSPIYDLELDVPLSSFQNFNYEQEPDYEEAHIDKVKDIVLKRHKIRGDIETLVHSMVSLRKKSEDLGLRQIELDSILNPISELQSLIDKAMESTESGEETCDVSRWNAQLIGYLDKISNVAIESLSSEDENLEFAVDQLNDEIHTIHFWHEQHSRKSPSNSTLVFEEEFLQAQHEPS